MSLAVLGISHRTAPLEVRERFVLTASGRERLLHELREESVAREAVLLSTCNRTELYLASDSADPIPAALALLCAHAGSSPDAAEPFLYVLRDRSAAEHLFRVAAGLESQLIGEAQIQGQVRAALLDSVASGNGQRTVGPFLSRLFNGALAVGAQVRTETALGQGAASVSSAAVELARRVLGPLKGRRALLLGAGDASELVLQCLAAEGVDGIVVANRDCERGRLLADPVGGTVVGYLDVLPVLAEADLLFSATSAPHAILTRDMVHAAVPPARERPLLIVDIAVPRDVDPAVATLPNVRLFNLDDLQRMVDQNVDRRRTEIPDAEAIVARGVADFGAWYGARAAVPVIRAMRARAEAVRRNEVRKALRRLSHLAPEDRDAIDRLTRQLMNKVLHQPTVQLKGAAETGIGDSVLQAARYLFELNKTRTRGAQWNDARPW